MIIPNRKRRDIGLLNLDVESTPGDCMQNTAYGKMSVMAIFQQFTPAWSDSA